MIKLEVGKFYRTRDGRTVGPIKQDGATFFGIDHPFDWPETTPYGECWCDDGEYSGLLSSNGYPCDLVAEHFPTTKIQVKTVRSVPAQTVDGLYIYFANVDNKATVGLSNHTYTTEEIRAHAARLIELADIMDEE